ncbi:MAG: HEAT repeat domain-containing protein [Armatimonadia bacterium]
MKIKTGTLLIAGALILLVGLTILLAPAPPPSTAGHDKEAEAKAEEQAKEKEKKKEEAPKVTLAQIKSMISSEDSHGVQKGLEELQKMVVTQRDAQLRKPMVDYVMTLARTDRREQVRAGAVGILQGVEGLEPEPIIAISKTDRSPDVRKAALLALAKFPPGGVVEQTLRQYAKDPDPGLRSMAIISLTQMLAASGKAGNEQLVMLLGQPDNDASAKAALTLHAQGTPALPFLIKTLYESKLGPQRHAAAMCIGLICAGYNPSIDIFARQAQTTHRQIMGDRKANLTGLQPLLWALKNDPYPATREIAAQGLGYLGDATAAAPLAAALKDPDAYVRRRAAAALITVPAAPVVPQIASAATTDKVPEVRRFAVEALGWVGSPAVVPALNQATLDRDASVRRDAAIQLGRIAAPAKEAKQAPLAPEVATSIVQSLSAMLDETADPDPDVRWAAVVALGKLHDKASQRVLVRALSDPSPQVSNSAERALQRLGVARQESEGFEG